MDIVPAEAATNVQKVEVVEVIAAEGTVRRLGRIPGQHRDNLLRAMLLSRLHQEMRRERGQTSRILDR